MSGRQALSGALRQAVEGLRCAAETRLGRPVRTRDLMACFQSASIAEAMAETLRRATPQGRALSDLEERVRGSLTEGLRRCLLTRHQVADQVSALVGREVSKDMLDKFTSPRAPHHCPPDVLTAVCRVTGWDEPLRMMCGEGVRTEDQRGLFLPLGERVPSFDESKAIAEWFVRHAPPADWRCPVQTRFTLTLAGETMGTFFRCERRDGGSEGTR